MLSVKNVLFALVGAAMFQIGAAVPSNSVARQATECGEDCVGPSRICRQVCVGSAENCDWQCSYSGIVGAKM